MSERTPRSTEVPVIGPARKVAVVAPTPVPFTRGGAERAWAGLHAALLAAGHDAELVKLPVRETTLAEVTAGYRAFSELDLSHFDVVISSKYPAWICPHPRHVLWMFHPLRGLYDTYRLFGLPTAPGRVAPATAALLRAVGQAPRREAVPDVLDLVDLAVASLGPDHPDLALPGPVSRLVVQWLDRVALDPSQIARHVALSRTVATRTGYLPEGVVARVAYAPSDLPTAAPGPGPARHLFTASRLDGPKRIDLLVRAMAHVPGDTELHIGGTGPEEARLRALASGDPRIRFLGFVPDDDLARHYAEAVAVPFVPLDEDYGLITVEAFAAGTPVVTTTDSGGPAELVRDGVDGAVVAPDPAVLGRALAEVAGDPERARAMGEEGRRRAAGITWPAVVRTLLGGAVAGSASPADPAEVDAASRGPSAPERVRRPGRARVVVLTTFRVADRAHGGQLRSFHLYGNLGRHVDVEVVSLTDGGPAGSRPLRPGLVETAVPISDAHRTAAEEMTLEVGLPVSDLAAGEHVALTPDYLHQLRDACRTADAVILAEPYLLPALDAAAVDLPFVYDAFNVEVDLKAAVLPPGPARATVLEAVGRVEHQAAARAATITVCSDLDGRRLTQLVHRRGSDAVVVANGTDCGATVPPDPATRRQRARRWLARYRGLDDRVGDVESLAVFFGSWHPPNLEAARLIIDAAAEVPEVVFVLGGRHGEAVAGQGLPRNVVLAGMVSDRAKDTLLGAADVALNPMLSGSGTNLKVLEYLAAGVPVVTTAFGMRGLELADGEHVLVAEPDRLAEAVRSALADPAAAARRAAVGRARVEELYDWPRLGDRLAEVVGEVVARERRARTRPPGTATLRAP